MIRLGFQDAEVTVNHGATPPLVYLDHFALMEVAENHADRFVVALQAKNGTLALSWINFIELAEVSPSTLAPVKALLRRLFPDRAVFLDTDSLAVARREEEMLTGTRAGAPFLDKAWANLYFGIHRKKSVNPLEPGEFIEMFEQPDLREKLDGIWEEGRSGIVAMFEDARTRRDADAAVAKRIRALPPKADPRVPPTRWIMIEGLKYVLKNNLNLTSGNHIRDFLHMVVPISYCDLVVLDQNWREAARQIQNALRGRGLLAYNDAAVFSSVSDFLEAIERWEPDGPPNGGESTRARGDSSTLSDSIEKATGETRTPEGFAAGIPNREARVDYIQDLHEKETNNYGLSLEIVGPNGLALVEEFRRLYQMLADREASSDLPEKDEISVTHFVVECVGRLALAVLSIFRLHCSDAAAHTRRAIEAAGFLVAMRKDRSLFRTWLNASDDEARYKEYRSAFRSGAVLYAKSDDPLVRHLRKLYDRCSVLSHPTISSFAGRVRPVETAQGEQTAAFHFFDVPPDGGLEMAGAFAWTLEAHVAILGLLTQSYKDDLRLEEVGWMQMCAVLEARVGAFRRSLRQPIDS